MKAPVPSVAGLSGGPTHRRHCRQYQHEGTREALLAKYLRFAGETA